MTSAPAARASWRRGAASTRHARVGWLALAVLAVCLTCLVALLSYGADTLLALGLAMVLLASSALTVRATWDVAGVRAMPRWYAPAALLVGLGVLVVHELTSGWSDGLSAADAVLLAAAPGALLVATEGPLWLALRRGRSAGVVLLATSALPAVAATRVLALDGLDTLVDGKVVDQVDSVEEGHLRNVRWFAGALAHSSPTPWGRAVAGLAARGNLTSVVVDDDGISGFVDRHPVRLGRLDWLGLPSESSSRDVLGVEVDGRCLGTITVADKLRDSVADDVEALSADGVRPVLVAPDGPRAAAVAALAGIELATPGAIDGEDCAVVSADPSGHSGAALMLGPDSDQIRLAQADLASGARALRVFRDTARTIRRTVMLGLAWHAVCVVLAVAGALTPWMAASVAVAGAAIVWAYAARS